MSLPHDSEDVNADDILRVSNAIKAALMMNCGDETVETLGAALSLMVAELVENYPHMSASSRRVLDMADDIAERKMAN